MTLVKICGLKNEDEITYAAKAGADFGGMVLFFPKSKRNIEIKKAAELVAFAHASLKLKMVAVMVSPGEYEISEAEKAGFDYLQIHGELSEEVLMKATRPVIKAFNVRDISEFDRFKNDNRISGFVFDAGIPGSGIVFDHSILKELHLDEIEESKKFVLLAGGLNPDNVKQALKEANIHGADTSSGVENEDKTGKSREKIFDFVREAKGAFSS